MPYIVQQETIWDLHWKKKIHVRCSQSITKQYLSQSGPRQKCIVFDVRDVLAHVMDSVKTQT